MYTKKLAAAPIVYCKLYDSSVFAGLMMIDA